MKNKLATSVLYICINRRKIKLQGFQKIAPHQEKKAKRSTKKLKSDTFRRGPVAHTAGLLRSTTWQWHAQQGHDVRCRMRGARGGAVVLEHGRRPGRRSRGDTLLFGAGGAQLGGAGGGTSAHGRQPSHAPLVAALTAACSITATTSSTATIARPCPRRHQVPCVVAIGDGCIKRRAVGGETAAPRVRERGGGASLRPHRQAERPRDGQSLEVLKSCSVT